MRAAKWFPPVKQQFQPFTKTESKKTTFDYEYIFTLGHLRLIGGGAVLLCLLPIMNRGLGGIDSCLVLCQSVTSLRESWFLNENEWCIEIDGNSYTYCLGV